MYKFIIDRCGKVEECTGAGSCRHVRFPLCLAIKYNEEVTEICADFILNISKSEIFIFTNIPLNKGSAIVMHFYIPPDKKLLSEFQGEVVAVNTANPLSQKGMHVKLIHYSQKDLKQLEEFLEEKRHLLDMII